MTSEAIGVSPQGMCLPFSDKTGKSEGVSPACPLCESGRTILVKRMDVQPLIENWNLRFGIDVSDEFRGVSVFELRECGRCSLRYFHPSVLAGSRQLYSQLSKLEWYYQPRKWEHEVALKDLRGCRKILEIGCGRGEFITQARQEMGLTVEGLEQNADAVEEAQRRGLQLERGNIRELAERYPAQYDAVCSFQVLEHVAFPLDFLKCCLALLRPGGKLVFGVPNADSFLRYQLNLLDMPPHHMTRWSAQVLSFLPQLLPVGLQAIRFEPLAPYHIKSYLDAHLSRLEPHRVVRHLRHRLLKGCLAKALELSRGRRLFRGHALYASFVRI